MERIMLTHHHHEPWREPNGYLMQSPTTMTKTRWKTKLRRFAGVAWKATMALIVLMLLMHPELQGLAPLADMVGALGLDGLLLVIEMYCVLGLGYVFHRAIIPLFTHGWNRYVAAPWGWQPSENILADGMRHVMHGVLCRSQMMGGLTLYLIYIAITLHYAPGTTLA
jgi:hypothetical protein